MDQFIGKMLDDRYEILDRIGVGGMAVVYKALCHRLHRYVAIKILKDEFLRDEESRERFQTESRAVAMLSHPNIVNVYDVSHSDGLDYIVMELIEGISLKEYMEQKGRLNWREVLHFSTQIAKALQHAHSRGVIHRDIKPHNIMLLKDGSIKVADFGIAQMIGAQKGVGDAIGSVHYVSPEQARGDIVDARSDIYSLGIVMYEMLTGTVPYDADQPSDVAMMHLLGGAKPPREIVPDIPVGMEQITLCAMKTQKSERYHSASQMLEDLEAFRKNPAISFAPQGGSNARMGRTSLARRNKRKTHRSIAAFVVGTLALVLVIVGILGLFNYLMGDLFTREDDVFVPNLYLASLTAAQEKYADTFVIVDETWVYDDQVAFGLILSQDPKPDKAVKPGATIKVTVSRGTEQVIMPQLTNMDYGEARAALNGFDVEIAVQYVESTLGNVKDGTVLRTEPVYGTVLSPNQTVELFVSRSAGGAYSSVPNLVGLNVDAAIVVLTKAGFARAPLRYSISKEAEGTVLSQSIAPDESVAVGTAIVLEVSSGEKAKAQEPLITVQPVSVDVLAGEAVSLSAAASVSDGGILQYDWYSSATGTTGDLKHIASTQRLDIATSVAGTTYYCCKITNTGVGSPTAVYTDMAEVTVKAATEKTTKVFTIALPEQGDAFEVFIMLDGEAYTAPFVVTAPSDSTQPRTVQIAVEALGTHEVRINLNGDLAWNSVEVF